MPGPPPPSKSYLLKIIDSSDDEDNDDDDDDEEEEEEGDRVARPVGPLLVQDSQCGSKETNANGTASITTPTEPKKKRKKKKKKKKRSSSSKTTTATTATTSALEEMEMQEPVNMNKKSVAFDTVTIRSFERVLGTGVVPCDGGWPLGLGKELQPPIGDRVESLDMETYESAKQERLRLRAKEKGLAVATDSLFCMTCGMDDEDAKIPELETRQWDFKHKSRNPLFHLMQEEQRMNILLLSSTPEEKTTEATSSSYVHAGMVAPKHRDSASKGSPDKKRPTAKTKHGSNNHPNGPPPSGNPSSQPGLHPTGGHSVHTRSNSKRERSGSVSCQERYNDTFTQVEVHRVRNELEELRFQRSGEGHVGCTCRKLDVYLLPPNAGKKAHHRRMNMKRVKEELSKRHLLPDVQKTREELELLLHTAVEKEPCCSGQDCPCVRNGIQCQADVCSCWHDSHQSKEVGASSKSEADASTPVDTIMARCGNVHGMYAVDFPKIQAHLDRVLNATRGNGGSMDELIDAAVVSMEQD